MQALKLRTAILALLVALATAWVLAPTVSAQQSTLNIATPTGNAQNLVPESQAAQLKFVVTYGYNNPAGQVSFASGSSVPLTFTPNCPPSILVTGPTTQIMALDSPSQSGGGGSEEYTFFFTATRDAPGLKSLKCTMTVAAGTQSTGITPPTDAKTDFTVSADYYALVTPKITKKVQQAGPQKNVPFAIELTNFGNARTQVNFEEGSSPNGKRWELVLPDQIILDSPNGGGEGKTVDTATVTVVTPYKNGWNNEQGAYQILMKVASADQADKKGNDLSANVLVRVRGVYVPGLEPTVMLAALIGSALILRLRKDEE